jgi:GDPmannose 4,6-dehydratase
VECAFAEIGRRIEWRGQGAHEQGLDANTGQILIETDPRYFRPTEVDILVGDASKARKKLGWTSRHSFKDLVTEMVAADLKAVENERWRANRID